MELKDRLKVLNPKISDKILNFLRNPLSEEFLSDTSDVFELEDKRVIKKLPIVLGKR